MIVRNEIYQEDEKACGIASLRMLLVSLTKDKGYRYLTLCKHPPYSLEELRLAAAKEGIQLSFKRTADKKSVYKSRTWPILLLFKGQNSPHLVFAKRNWYQKIIIFDPALGWVDIGKNEFMSKWSGVYGEGKIIFKKTCPCQKPVLIPFYEVLLSLLFSLLSSVLLLGGLYFIGKENNAIYSIFLFVSCGLMEIVKRIFALRAMKRFDKKWLSYVINASQERTNKNYEKYHSLRTFIFSGWQNLFSEIAVAASFTFLVGLNEPIFFIAVLGLMAYLIVMNFSVGKTIRQRKEKIQSQENTLLSLSTCQSKKLASLVSLNEESFRFGNKIVYERTIYFILVIALAFIPFLFEKNISLNHYLFIFFALGSIGESLRAIVAFEEERELKKSDYRYFIEYFVKIARQHSM